MTVVGAGVAPASAATTSLPTVEVSADSFGGNAVEVPTIVVHERGAGEIGAGSVVLAAPDGFRFAERSAVVRSVPTTGGLRVSAGGCDDGGASKTSVVPSATHLVFEVCAPSTRPVNLQIDAVAVRATAGSPLARGPIVIDASSTAVIAGLPPGSPLVELVEIAGAAVRVEMAPSWATTTAGTPVSFAVDAVDRFGNPIPESELRTTITAIPDTGAEDAGASCSGTTCLATRAGGYWVDVASGSVTAGAVLDVRAAEPAQLHVFPREAPVVAGEALGVIAHGRDRYGNFVESVVVDDLRLVAVDGGGGSTASATCDAIALSCVATDAGRYRLIATSGALAGEYWDDIVVRPGTPSSVVADVPTTARATVTNEFFPFTVTVLDRLGNRIADTHVVDIVITRAGSGVGGSAGGPQVFPRTGFTDGSGEFRSGYDAGPLPGRDEITVTISTLAPRTPLLQATFVVDVVVA